MLKSQFSSPFTFRNLRTLLAVMLCLGGLALAFGALPSAFAQRNSRDAANVARAQFRGVAPVVQFDVSPPLRDIEVLPVSKATLRPNEDRFIVPIKIRFAPEWDPVVQATLSGTEAPEQEIPGPVTSFNGQPNVNGVSPPDPVGSVGPNHVVTMANSSFQVFNKTGTSLYGPAANNTLWSGFGGPCQTENAGDPVVIYDRLADRWLLSQFTSAGPSYFFCVAISASPDPTGSYYRYAIATGSNFPDYPKVGVWPNAYFVSTREFAGATYAGVGAYALNRAQALAGNPNAQVIAFLAPPSPTYTVGDGLLPADMEGITPPPVGSPNYFVGSMDNNGPYGAPQDALTLWKFHADFANPASSSFVLTNTIGVAAFNSVLGLCGGTRSCIPQPSTTNRLDHLGYRQRPLFRLAYRNFGTHESLVTNQSVSAGAGAGGEVSGIRWWELRSPNAAPVIYQQGTFAPGLTDGIHRWMASAAISADGSIGLGYSASSSAVFPSVYYTGRRASDPLGTMPQGEAAIVNGTGSQTAGGSRWGDYTSLSVDPVDDLTFWHVNEYVPTTSATGWRIRVGSFNFAQGPAPARGTARFTINDCFGGSGLAGATITIDGTVYGSTLSNGVYDAPLLPGTYSYSVSKLGFTTVTGNVTVAGGTITPVQLCLQGSPIIVSGGASIISAGPNGVIDPGETVTVAFGLRNTNICSSSALTATLQAGGGVTSPSGAQNYGSICGGNPTVFRTFTFTAAPGLSCGSTITASLAVTDGATNHGTFNFTFPTGSTSTASLQNFDSVTAPALPAGWTPTASGSGTLPTTVTSFPDTAPNAAFLSEGTATGLSELTSSNISIPTAGMRLNFRLQHNTELNWDGLVLEISIGGGAFQDIETAGGSFVTGGYTGTLSSSVSQPLGARRAWSGLSGGTAAAPAYISVVVNLPPAATGQSVRFKWRQGSDGSVAPTTNPGSRIDTLALSSIICGGNAPTVAGAVSRKTHGAAGTFDIPLPLAPLTGTIGYEPRAGTPGEYQMVVAFNNPVTVGSASVTTGTGSATSSTAGNVVTVNLTGVTDRQRLEVTLANVSDGSNLGSVRIPIGILSGDIIANGNVTSSDIGQAKVYAQTGVVNASTFRGDVATNGAITASDVSLVKARSGNTLP